MIKAVIIEDEIAGQKIISRNLSDNFKQIEIAAIIDNYDEAVSYLSEHKVDLVFLDVQIKGGTGFDVLKEIEDRTFETIFVTAYDHYAIEALNSDVSYYLLKPFKKDDFVKGVKTVLEKVNKKAKAAFIKIPNKGGYTTLSVNEVHYFQSDGPYTHVYTNEDKILSSKNLGHYEKIVPGAIFKRCHHSFLVNINHVKQLKKGRNGSAVMSDGTDIPISQRKMSSFFSLFD